VRSLMVSIVNYRTPTLVVACVESIKRHRPRQLALEIVVVDNGSGDDSLRTIAAAHPDIRLIDAGANLGFAGGNNLALRDCRADFAMLLNSDAAVEAGTFDRLVAALDERPDVGAVGARIVNADDGADQDYPCRFPSLLQMGLRALHGAEHPGADADRPVSLDRLHGAGMVVRGSLLRSVGLFDDGFFMYDEDVDWCLRARQQGWRLMLVPAARVLHHGGASSGRAPSGRREAIEASPSALRMRFELRRSRYRLYRKHRSGWELCLLKAVTDGVLLLQSLRAALWWLLSPSRRAAVAALLQCNLRIIAINPFVPASASHGG
jgi:N-acetylglucosaminyl-diphospho-decaprenol L-rhamnosyltransferase